MIAPFFSSLSVSYSFFHDLGEYKAWTLFLQFVVDEAVLTFLEFFPPVRFLVGSRTAESSLGF